MPEESKPVTSEELAKQLSVLQKQMGELAAAKTALERKVTAQESQLLSEDFVDFLESKRGGKSGKAEDTAPDFDAMTGGQIADHFQKSLEARLEKLQEAHAKQLAELNGTLQKSLAFYDLELTKTRNPKFSEALQDDSVRAKLKAISEENPQWNAERIWKHYQTESRLAAEEQERQSEAERKAALADQLKAVGEKGGLPHASATEKGMDAQEAAEKAWELSQGGEGPTAEEA